MAVQWQLVGEVPSYAAQATYASDLETGPVAVVYNPQATASFSFVGTGNVVHDLFVIMPLHRTMPPSQLDESWWDDTAAELVNDHLVEAVYFHRHASQDWPKIRRIIEREARALGVVFDGDDDEALGTTRS